MRSICVLLLDGLGDRAYEALGGLTSNEAAATPALDAFAARAQTGLLWPLGPGRAPSSEVAHWALLGYRPEEFPGRAVLEALGRGQEVDPGDVVAYAALRPVERRGGALWVTGRADDEGALAAFADLEVDGLRFRLAPVGGGEAILRVSGGASDAVTDSDPFFRDRHPVARPQALAPEAEATARAAAAWSRRVVRALDGRHAVTLKWWGRLREAPSFRARHGLDGAVVGGSAFLAGLAAAVGLRFVAASGLGVDAAAQLLADGAGFVWCHTKALDEAGHTKDPRARVRALAELDPLLAPLAAPPFADAVVAVTGDHATPAVPEVIHSGDVVPFLLAGPGVRPDGVARFGESHCAGGLLGRIRGEDAMPLLLNAADRPLFLGSRPTTTPGAAGFPAEIEPLDA